MNYTNRFQSMYWLVLIGLLFATFHIKLNDFDVLVDSFGYLLIAAGTFGLAKWSRHFALACLVSLIMLPVSLVSIGLGLAEWEPIIWLRDVGTMGLLWFLLGAVINLATSARHAPLASRAYRRRNLYVLLGLLALVARLTASVFGIGLFAGLLAIASFVALMLVLHVLWQGRSLYYRAEFH